MAVIPAQGGTGARRRRGKMSIISQAPVRAFESAASQQHPALGGRSGSAEAGVRAPSRRRAVLDWPDGEAERLLPGSGCGHYARLHFEASDAVWTRLEPLVLAAEARCGRLDAPLRPACAPSSPLLMPPSCARPSALPPSPADHASRLPGRGTLLVGGPAPATSPPSPLPPLPPLPRPPCPDPQRRSARGHVHACVRPPRLQPGHQPLLGRGGRALCGYGGCSRARRCSRFVRHPGPAASFTSAHCVRAGQPAAPPHPTPHARTTLPVHADLLNHDCAHLPVHGAVPGLDERDDAAFVLRANRDYVAGEEVLTEGGMGRRPWGAAPRAP